MVDRTRPNLSALMAGAARELEDQPDRAETLTTAVRIAVDNVEGCEAAGFSIVQARRNVVTEAATEQLVEDADQLQYETGQGPCLDAIWEQSSVYSASLATDDRWPEWGPRVAEATGVRSVLSVKLFTKDNTLGALNMYSRRLDGFSEDGRDLAHTLAAHVAVALASAGQIDSLSLAIDTRTMIGQATGMLMERFAVTPPVAFAILTRTASAAEMKLREVARELVETGSLHGHPARDP